MYLFPHKKTWAAEYARESERIHLALGDTIELFHIGSTAIENLYSKDCIDILGVVNSLSVAEEIRGALVEIGYLSKGAYGIKGREYFSKKIGGKVHLHIFEEGNPEIKKHLFFVEVMGSNPNLIEKLNTLKYQLHEKYPDDKERYQKEKIAFYDEIHDML